MVPKVGYLGDYAFYLQYRDIFIFPCSEIGSASPSEDAKCFGKEGEAVIYINPDLVPICLLYHLK